MEGVVLIKSNGDHVPFDAERIAESVRRAGGASVDVAAIVAEVQKMVRTGMTTKEVYATVHHAIARRSPFVACRYGLRDALRRLGPAGFYFEKYLAALLARTGYRTEMPDEFQGACVRHEIDVVAHQGDKTYAIEAKFRNGLGDHVDLKDTLACYARYLDLLDGAAVQLCPRFDAFWIVTNGKFSDRAMQYAKCKGMPLIGWSYPDRASSLAGMIDRSGLYPITVLGISASELAACAHAGMLLCDDLTKHESVDIAHRVGISQSRAEELIELAAGVCEQRAAVAL